jgi:hypothetical protein
MKYDPVPQLSKVGIGMLAFHRLKLLTANWRGDVRVPGQERVELAFSEFENCCSDSLPMARMPGWTTVLL